MTIENGILNVFKVTVYVAGREDKEYCFDTLDASHLKVKKLLQAKQIRFPRLKKHIGLELAYLYLECKHTKGRFPVYVCKIEPTILKD